MHFTQFFTTFLPLINLHIDAGFLFVNLKIKQKYIYMIQFSIRNNIYFIAQFIRSAKVSSAYFSIAILT